MKKLLKKSAAVFLVFVMLSGMFTCFAYDFGDKDVSGYKSYLLLGDSIASGWSDVEDIESRFVRVEGSYGAYVADDLGVENYYPMACIGFRTVEMRYILEEDFEPDRFLYYSIDEELMDTVHAPAMRKAIAETDLITLNIGGNDWGSFLGWHVMEEMDKQEEVNEEFMEEVKKYLETAGTTEDTMDAIIDIAALCGALPDIAQALPKALETGLRNYFVNWNYMIEDILALNPDVTLLVIGMFDNSLQDPDSEYVTVNENEDPAVTNLKQTIGQTVVDFANIPMKEGASKYGYIFVDTTGTLCEEFHPSRTPNGGHRFIADRILEALPDSKFPFTDVDKASGYFNAVEYMYRNSIMAGVTATEFKPDDTITSADLEKALFAITGTENLVAKSESGVSRITLAAAAFKAETALVGGIGGFINGIKLFVSTLFAAGPFGLISSVTRGEAAATLMNIINN